MRKFSIILFAALSFFSVASCEVLNGPAKLYLKILDNLEVNGFATLELVQAKSVTVHGPLKFSRLRVENALDVTGPVNGHKGEFGSLKVLGPVDVNYVRTGSLQVSGPVTATNIEVSKQTEVFGPLTVTDGHFENITVTADTITLENVTAKDITIKPTKEPEQVLILKGNSKISGNILFESGHGVLQHDDQVMIHGTVSGTSP